MSVMDLKYATLTIATTIAADDVVVVLGEGNFNYTIARNVEYKLNAGSLATAKVRTGDDIPMEVSFEAEWETVSSTATGNSEQDIITALKATTGNTDLPNPCVPACDLELVYNPSVNCSGDSGNTYTFPDFRYESIAFDAGAGTIAITGKCRALEPTYAS